MKRKWTKAVCRACGYALVPVSLAVASLAQSGSAPALPKAEDAYMNIQVLKGIPAEHVIPNMDFFADSLGVTCEYCHVTAREKDDKPTKQTARKMIQMVRAMNEQNFEGRRVVTCFTCHRGSADPVGIPPLADGSLPPAAAGGSSASRGGTEANVATPDQLLDRYAQAVGGVDATKKITTRVVKATVINNSTGRGQALDLISKAPDRGMSVLHQDNVEVLSAYSGDSGWRRGGAGLPNNQVRDIRTYELDDVRFRDQLYLVTHLKQILSRFQPVRSEKVGDQDAYALRATAWGRVPVTLFFDKSPGNLLRLVYLEEFELGDIPTQIDFADYRDADGTKFPYRWTIAQPGAYQTVRIDQVQQNVPLEDAQFSKPAKPTP